MALHDYNAALHEPQTNMMDKAMSSRLTINWEVAFYIVLLVLAILTRFIGLGDRTMSHDESLHVKYSYTLATDGQFAHTPLMHGPVLFHITALDFFLFGANDFTGRIYPAVLGILTILLPKLLFERWLGKWGAAMTSLLIFISPMLLYHHRYIREDTPALFFTILMVYGIFAYLDGKRPRRVWQLVLFSAATLLNLASKETAFMYIALFGFILTVFLLFQMAQTSRRRVLGDSVGKAMQGLIIIPLASIIAILIIEFLRSRIGGSFTAQTLGNITVTPAIQSAMQAVLIGVPLALVIAFVLFGVVRVAGQLVGGLFARVVDWIGIEAGSLFRLLLAGIIAGTVLALALTVILNVVDPQKMNKTLQAWADYDAGVIPTGQTQPIPPAEPRPTNDQVLQNRLTFLSWTGIAILFVAGAVLLTAVRQYRKLPALPWRDLALVLATGAVWCLLMIIAEERLHNVPNVSSEVRKTIEYHYAWVDVTWIIGILAVLGIYYLRTRTDFFAQMRRFSAFDICLVLGTLVLPWLAAIPLFFAGYPLDLNSYTAESIVSMIPGVIPFIAVAFAIGIAWNADVWLLCAAAFYGLFTVFYTTFFTNPNGIATGLVGSLGYWMTQQGVYRAGQPAYYYILIEMPIYEYLALIGGAFAGVLGLSQLWKFRAERELDKLNNSIDVPAADIAVPEMDSVIFAERSDEAMATSAPTMVSMSTATYEAQRTSEESLSLEDARVLETLENAADTESVTPINTLEDELTIDVKPKNEDYVDDWDTGKHIPLAERLLSIPFAGFIGYWSVLIFMVLTVSGEKMPWLTTHITLPMLFVTGWYLGNVLKDVNWGVFFKKTWLILLFLPILIVAAANVMGNLPVNQSTSGLALKDLSQIMTWLGAVVMAGAALYGLFWLSDRTNWGQTLRLAVLAFFLFVGVLTARTAWMAAYINYDYPTEFMVYAHGAPGNKEIINKLDEISRRVTDGRQIKVGYDNKMSWPGAWYFIPFPNAIYLGDVNAISDPDSFVAIAVDAAKEDIVDAALGDNFEKFNMPRLWWPMQDYFGLDTQRVMNALTNPAIRKGLWDIWFNRDYRSYASATGAPDRFNLNQWPVIDRMLFYVRKDVAAKIWDFGVGSSKVPGLPADPFVTQFCGTCSASLSFAPPPNSILNQPRGVALAPNGDLYVADTQNNRVVVYDIRGQFLREFGSTSPDIQGAMPPVGTFRQPWGIAVDKEGLVYVADTWNHRVQVFTSDGTPMRSWGHFENYEPGGTTTSDGFYGPRDIKIDAQGHIYVADTGNERIRVYDAQGTFLYDIGSVGTQPGQLKEPVGLAINNELGEIYVANTWDKRIEVYTLQGEYRRNWSIRAWTGTSEAKDSGNRPYLSLDWSGRYLFVTDADAGRVLVYDIYGNAVTSFGKLGTAPYTLTQFGILGAVTMDPTTGVLYMADAGGARILRFEDGSISGLPALSTAPLSNPVTQEATSEAPIPVTPETDQRF